MVLRASSKKALEVMATLHYAGHNDWRVPTIEKLISLFDPLQGTRYLDSTFNAFPLDGIWSADSVANPASIFKLRGS